MYVAVTAAFHSYRVAKNPLSEADYQEWVISREVAARSSEVINWYQWYQISFPERRLANS